MTRLSTLTILFLFSLLTHSLYGFQVGVGPKMGPGVSYLTGIELAQSQLTFSVGGGATFYIIKPFFLTMDLLVQQKGTKGKRLDYRASYFSVPIKAGVKIIEHFSFLIGPQFSFLLNASANAINVTAQTNSSNIDLVFGARYYFPTGNSRIIIDFLIEIGFSDMTTSNFTYATDVNENRSFYLMVGWEFGL